MVDDSDWIRPETLEKIIDIARSPATIKIVVSADGDGLTIYKWIDYDNVDNETLSQCIAALESLKLEFLQLWDKMGYTIEEGEE